MARQRSSPPPAPEQRSSDHDVALEKGFAAAALPDADRRDGAEPDPTITADAGASLYRDNAGPARGKEQSEGASNFASVRTRAIEAAEVANKNTET